MHRIQQATAGYLQLLTAGYHAGRRRLLSLCSSRRVRETATIAGLCVGLAVQVGLCLVSLYLIDLAIDLAELWALLARKHLEITL